MKVRLTAQVTPAAAVMCDPVLLTVHPAPALRQFVRIPRPTRAALAVTLAKVEVVAVQEVEGGAGAEPRFCSVCGEAGSGRLEAGPGVGLQAGTAVLVTRPGPASLGLAITVQVEPVSQADWAVLQLNRRAVEGAVLEQVGSVNQ